MKTIEDYTNYCTLEQTNKAIKLGCPCDNPDDYTPIKLPTTQQMIGWLMENGLSFDIEYYTNQYTLYYKDSSAIMDLVIDGNIELAAIDAALDYLEKGE